MIGSTTIIDINDASGAIVAPEWLARAEAVHRQLRPGLPDDYKGKMMRVFAGGGRMCVAVRDEVVDGIAVYRIYENTYDGLHMYVDDMVVDEARRSSGVGSTLFGYLQDLARETGCASCNLDSGVQRARAHKFYFREGMGIVGFHFVKALR